jgi:N-acetylmuramoyl-L-alanine amidase
VRVWVAALFIASVLVAAVIGGRSHPTPAPSHQALLPSTTLPPPTSIPPTATTEPAPANPVTTLPPPPPLPDSQAKVLVSRTGVVLPIQSRDGAEWKVTTPCGNTAVVQGTPVGQAQVVLDAGHGGDESGAVGPNGLTEAKLNLAVAQQAKAALERSGVSVVLTRTADYRMTLESRAKVALAVHPNAFVSVHHNAEPDGPFPRPGTETYYQVATPESKRLAGLVYEEVVTALSRFQAPWVADTDAGAKYRKNSAGDDYYGILRRTHGVVGALAELAFITDPAEADLLARPDVQQVEGEAVARGIVRFLTSKDRGSGFTEPYPRDSPAGSGGGGGGCVDPAL